MTGRELSGGVRRLLSAGLPAAVVLGFVSLARSVMAWRVIGLTFCFPSDINAHGSSESFSFLFWLCAWYFGFPREVLLL